MAEDEETMIPWEASCAHSWVPTAGGHGCPGCGGWLPPGFASEVVARPFGLMEVRRGFPRKRYDWEHEETPNYG